MTIKVLGAGCPNCEKLEKMVKESLTERGLTADVLKVKELKEIMAYRVLMTPALVINEEVVCAGRVPSKAELHTFISNSLAKEG
jgi:small redox-active disulfide protein 2